MCVSRIGKIRVNLIADNQHAVFLTDFTDAKQFFFCPDAPDRIVRTAQQQHFYVIIHNLALHIGKIHFISAVFQNQRIDYQLPIILCDFIGKRIVHRLLNQNRVSLLRKCPNRNRNGKYNARRGNQPASLRLPAKPLCIPVVHGGKIRILDTGIAENSMFCQCVQPFEDCGRRREIHISYPQREHIFRHTHFARKIVFETIGSPAVRNRVKINRHGVHLSRKSNVYSIP